MASTLPGAFQNECCPPACDGTTTVQIPGAKGEPGTDGTDGVDGDDAWTLFTSNFTIPAEGASTVAAVGNTSFIAINDILYAAKSDGSVVAYLQAVAIGGATSVTLKNIEDTPSSAYVVNSAPGSILTTGSRLVPAGIQGPGTTASGAAGGDLKGTYPNPKILVGNTKGSSLWGNGTDTVAVPAGTNGHMLAYDSTDAEGVKSFKALPLTGDTDLADNRILRADGATGLPVPTQPSKVTITDNGAIRADGSGGNARGTDAIDLQVTRAGAAQVASGTNSTIGGGQNNTASNTSSVVSGGGSNSSTGISSSVAGGSSNTASGLASSICGGASNAASGNSSHIGGGDANIANTSYATIAGGTTNTAGNGGGNSRATVGGGAFNTASGLESTVAGGSVNTASGPNTTVGGGENNIASGDDSTICGGDTNVASGNYSKIPGGINATADKYGQLSHASGRFAANGDAQTSEFVLRIATTNATPAELKLDGATASFRMVVPNNTSWIFSMLLVARRDTGTTSIYKSEGQVENTGGTVTATAVTTTEINDGIGLPPTPVAVTADDPNNSLIITVTGVAAQNIRWVAHVRVVECSY